MHAEPSAPSRSIAVVELPNPRHRPAKSAGNRPAPLCGFLLRKLTAPGTGLTWTTIRTVTGATAERTRRSRNLGRSAHFRIQMMCTRYDTRSRDSRLSDGTGPIGRCGSVYVTGDALAHPPIPFIQGAGGPDFFPFCLVQRASAARLVISRRLSGVSFLALASASSEASFWRREAFFLLKGRVFLPCPGS